MIFTSARLARASSALVALLIVSSCSGGDSGPGAPSALTATSAATFTATVASAVTPSPSVTVKDASGRGVSGVAVHWQVTSGGGTISGDTTRTNASGVATLGSWTLGTAAGTQELQAAVDGLSTVRFTAQVAAGPLSKLNRIAGDAQPGVVGSAVTTPPSVRAEDSFGNPIVGAAVNFTVVSGGGTISGGSAQTNANGVATAGGWTLGGTKGQQLVRATGPGGVQVAFSAIAAAGAPALVEIVSGNGQQGFNGAEIPSPPSVRVRDSFNNPVGNVAVTFTPGPNSGTVIGGTKVTNEESGVASPTAWILGESTTQTLVASVASANNVAATINAVAEITGFKIEVRWVGVEPTARTRSAVEQAIQKWRSILVNSTGVSQANIAAGACRFNPALNEVVEGLLLFASVGTIDGAGGSGGNVLANANFCFTHGQTGFPSIGSILIDQSDVASLESSGLIDPVLTHEIGHSIGFVPSRMIQSGFLQGNGTCAAAFNGPNAVQQYAAAGSSGSFAVPVQTANSGGGCSTGGHWDEAALGRELMTPFISSTGGNPLSRITAGMFRDLGHQVNFSRTDAFFVGSSIMMEGFPGPVADLRNDFVPVAGGAKALPMVRSVKR